MAFPDIRNRARFLFVAVMVGHVLLISSQVNSQRGVSLLQEALTTTVAEAQRVAWGVVGGVRHVWESYVALRHVRSDNERLTREVADLRVQMQQEQALAHGVEQLRGLLDLRTRLGWTTTAAEVIAGSVSPAFRTITIDKGALAGLRTDMAVIAPAGVVGRVVQASARAASVQLLNDQNAAASVIVESGAQGTVTGQVDGTLRLEYLSATASVTEGDIVITAGVDGVYPKGLRVGRISVVEKAGTSYRRVMVTPAVDFSSLETVLIVLTPPARPGGEVE
ncbi:MAG: rod shape-determining protein MreC [Vicinamibacterales bacterium]|nr:rod shape-determining protein MreC [Vicinamibacterales bacterium]